MPAGRALRIHWRFLPSFIGFPRNACNAGCRIPAHSAGEKQLLAVDLCRWRRLQGQMREIARRSACA
jgi:hypothetical protein